MSDVEELRCPICRESYSQWERELPMLGPCGHRVCQNCIRTNVWCPRCGSYFWPTVVDEDLIAEIEEADLIYNMAHPVVPLANYPDPETGCFTFFRGLYVALKHKITGN